MESTPQYWVESAPFSVRPLARWGHMGCMELPQKAHTSVEQLCFYRQGLTLVCNCSQLPGAWLSAAGTPLLRGRPGGGNRLVVGPAARLAWCAGSGRSHSKGDGPTIDLTQFQPRTPGRSLGGNALSGFSSILASQNGPQLQRVSPRQGNEVKPEKLEKAPYKEKSTARFL